MKLRGRITIGHFTSNDGPDGWHIEIIDETSRTHLVSLVMSEKDFATCLGGRGEVPCSFEFRPDCAGLYMESKTEWVLWSGEYNDHKGQRAAVAKWEVDGWRGDANDLRNNHNRHPDSANKSYRVRFWRYVTWRPRARKNPV